MQRMSEEELDWRTLLSEGIWPPGSSRINLPWSQNPEG